MCLSLDGEAVVVLVGVVDIVIGAVGVVAVVVFVAMELLLIDCNKGVDEAVVVAAEAAAAAAAK